MVSFLGAGNKTIDQTHSILQSKEPKNLSIQATEVSTGNLAMGFRDKDLLKRMANSDNKCYNFYKFGHLRRNSLLSNKRLNRNTQ